MKKTGFCLTYNSIRFKIFLPILLSMFPLFFSVFYYNFYVNKVLHNQVAESTKNLLGISMNNLDNKLQVVQTYLSDIASLNTDVISIQSPTNSSENIYADIRIKNKLISDISMFKPISCIFVYNINTNNFISAFDDDVDYAESQMLTNYFVKASNDQVLKPLLPSTVWKIGKVGQNYYLYRIIHVLNIYVGACFDVNSLLGQLDYPTKIKDVTLLLLDENREPTSAIDLIAKNNIDLSGDFKNYYISGDTDRYLVLGDESKYGNFSFIALIPDRAILENLPFVQALIYIIIIFSIICLTLSIFYLRRIVIYPLKKLIRTMKLIRGGDIDIRVPPIRTSDEFILLNNTFNNMMDQIKQLKINIYEDQVLQQKEELRRLQLEINPHFFLNSLNIVYSLAEARDYILIKEMTLCLMKYFRFIFYSDRNRITLKEELEHVQNYIRIQELRYPESFQYIIDAPETLLDCLVPPLILQTFVENTNKYAFSLDEFNILTIQISEKKNNDKPSIKIVINNTGRHIETDILNLINNGDKIIDKNGEVHTGIWNLQNRLRLLYSGESSITVRNIEPMGVSAEVIIPLHMKGEDEL